MVTNLVKPDFIVGSEKKFFEFISELNDKDKIALISHGADLDGIAAAKIANSAIDADVIKFADYEDINNSLVKELKNNEIKKVIFTDLRIDDKKVIGEIEKFADILIIDHHKVGYDFNSDKTVFLNAQDFCAGYLTYYLFSKTQNIEKLDWLVACSCISDFCHVKPAEWLEKAFEKYGDKFEREGNYVRKSGKFWDLQYNLSLSLIYFRENPKRVLDSIGEKFGDIGDLERHASEVQKYVEECLSRFEKEKLTFNRGYFWEFTPKFKIGSMISSISGTKYPNRTIIIARNEGELYHFSARRQNRREDMDLFLKDLIEGLKNASAGGHVAAAGGHVLVKDKKEFKKRLEVK